MNDYLRNIGGLQNSSALQSQMNALSALAQQQSGNLYMQQGVASACSTVHRGKFNSYELPAEKPKEKSMFQEIVSDVKGFVKEHRGMIYFVALALLIDHFVFNGAFKDRLKAMAEKLVGKIEQKIEDAK